MKEHNTLSKPKRIILYLLAGICAVLIILVSVFSVIQAVESKNAPKTERENLAYYNWYDHDKLRYWDFSNGHVIRIYVRKTTEENFELQQVIFYAMNEEYGQMQISANENLSNAARYDYEMTDDYLYLYNQTYQEEGKKPLPTLILRRTEEWLN